MIPHWGPRLVCGYAPGEKRSSGNRKSSRERRHLERGEAKAFRNRFHHANSPTGTLETSTLFFLCFRRVVSMANDFVWAIKNGEMDRVKALAPKVGGIETLNRSARHFFLERSQ